MKIIAWYLPQFHDIPENDEWWGKGFTDWVNVKKGKKIHSSQHQPRIPLDKQYYDLLDDDVKKWQVDLAKEYGVYGFCIHHYWFGGKLLLEKPMEQYLENKNLDLPFCINWANEHWTTSWNGGTKTLIKQDYGKEEDWEKHFNYFLPFFKDARYIKEDDRPLIVIFIPQIIGCLKDMLNTWQKLARMNGFPGLCIAYANKGGEELELSEEKKVLFDYCIDYQPAVVYSDLEKSGKHGVYGVAKSIWRASGKKVLNRFGLELPAIEDKSLRCDSYENIWCKILNRMPVGDNNIPGAIVDWDNTARKGEKGSYFSDACPDKFFENFKQLILRTREVYKQDKIFVFSWNEWAEGGYLEPDEENKYGYLEAVKRALLETDEFPNT